MTDVLRFETTKAFTRKFKEVKRVALAGGIVELREGNAVFVFQRKPGTGGFYGALKGRVARRAKTEDLLGAGEPWEAAP
ncbi:MAG TPA: hypothetical protein PLT00_09665 [Verrucomicrobiota bacterium]|mgnify:CR=1 FL=1|jgi:predicted Rdx family selenoprotein|nr:hypothetical protein [Verrucomicrobiota bacterium]HPY30343.1 hypothetical protein [Verrucomicrobiota bacterium]HQB16964.1 hypothetical protein [Verrucomicrobiota bacterium]